MVFLFAASIFTGALLLFWVQPLFAKLLLPLLGGAPAVWNTAIVFYQAALLVGYGYAHLSTAILGVRRQVLLHLAILALPALAIPFGLSSDALPQGTDIPVLWLLATMATTVGVPFFVVSATSPLVQRWFLATGHPKARNPYALYSASNAGSLLALLAFPFFLEPMLSTAAQSALWAVGYVVLAALLTVCGLTASRLSTTSGTKALDASNPEDAEAPTWGRRAGWIALAAVPSSLMVGVTTHISAGIAVVPLLWVIPLALYLLSFILVFSESGAGLVRLAQRFAPIALCGLVFCLAVPISKPVFALFAIHLGAFFLLATSLHGELAARKPPPRRLTEFYFWMSVGGVVGGSFNALAAPLVFTGVHEYPVALVAAAALLPAIGARPRGKTLLDVALAGALGLALSGAIALERAYGLASSEHASALLLAAGVLTCLLWARQPVRLAAALTVLLVVGAWQHRDPRRTLLAERSFFGVHRVVELPDGSMRHLLHGRIVHGSQSAATETAAPISYYYPNGPVGRFFAERGIPPAGHVAAIGLGVGTIAAYAQPGQSWTFFEIDPVVLRIASNPALFTFLRYSRAPVGVVLGDGRLSLVRSQGKYDLIVLDAFSSDSVPAHLLTREAVELYRDKLRGDGAILINITNKMLDLEPLLAAHAESLGMRCLVWNDDPIDPKDRRLGKVASCWAVLARSQRALAGLGPETWRQAGGASRLTAWTDDYSSIVSVLRVR